LAYFTGGGILEKDVDFFGRFRSHMRLTNGQNMIVCESLRTDMQIKIDER